MLTAESKIDTQFFESNDMTFVINQDCYFVDIYATMPELLFLDRNILIGQEIKEIIPGELGEKLQHFCRNIFRTRKSSSIEYKMSSPAGYRWFYAFGKHISHEGRSYAVIECNDIDEIKFREVQRRDDINDKLATLAGGLAHEINNPLAIINYHLKQLTKKLADIDEVSCSLKECTDATDRIHTILKEILFLNSIPNLELKEISLEREVFELIEQHRTDYEDLDITINFSCHLPQSNIQGDSNSMNTCISNLLDNAKNALKHSVEKRIDIYLEELSHIKNDNEERYFQVRICDTGEGVHPDYRHRIFDTFFSTHMDKKHQGLGLNITKYLLMLMNAEIRYEASPSGGSCFIIDFKDTLPQS